jgi:hypothetical protein
VGVILLWLWVCVFPRESQNPILAAQPAMKNFIITSHQITSSQQPAARPRGERVTALGRGRWGG